MNKFFLLLLTSFLLAFNAEALTFYNVSSLNRSMIHHWKLNDDAANTTVADSVGSATGTSTTNTSTLTATGVVSKALSFNGTTQRVDFGHISDIENHTGSFSISTWVYRNSVDVTNADGIIGNWYWSATVNNRRGTCLRWYINTSSLNFILETTNGSSITEISASSTVNISGWHHVVGTWDFRDKKARLYVDGALTATSSAGLTYANLNASGGSNSPWYIGYSGVNAGWLNGLVDNSMFFNKALTLEEITMLYNSGNGTESF